MRSAAARIGRRPLTLGLALLALCALLGWDRPALLLGVWLAAWWFWSGALLGAAALQRMHALTGGRWGTALAPGSRALQRATPWLLLLALPLAGAAPLIYPWAAGADWAAALHEPAFAQAWFAPAFVAVRMLLYAAGALLSARLPQPAIPARNAVLGLIGYTVLGSLASVDLVMSLQAGWTSSVFGWLVLSGQVTAGLCAAIVAAGSALRDAAPAATEAAPPPSRDLGNLLLAWVMLQAYLQFMQFLIIWAANLPREVVWYLPRLHDGWGAISIALVVLQFAAPTVALLWRRLKDDPRILRRLATALLGVQALGTWWLVLPSLHAGRVADAGTFGLALLATTGMGLVVMAAALPARGWPRRDTREVLHGA